MLITSFNGLTLKSDIKVFKPCSSLMLVQNYGDGATEHTASDIDTACIQVRLINSLTGRVTDICPEMKLITLSGIHSQAEGFFRRAKIIAGATNLLLKGKDCYRMLLDANASLALSNDTYLDIKLTNLHADASYELYGIEKVGITSTPVTYQKFYMSAGELEKQLNCEGKEAIAIPFSTTDNDLDIVTEITLHPKNSQNTPIYGRIEMEELNRNINDICGVRYDNLNKVAASVATGYNITDYGMLDYVLLPLDGIQSINIKRANGNNTIAVILIDSKA